MHISVLSVFPKLYDSFLETSIIKKAQDASLASIQTHSFFSYVAQKERIDAPTFGHGAGMLIKPEVVGKAIDDISKVHGKPYTVFFSPQGKKLNQRLLKKIYTNVQKTGHLLLVPSRYEGMDARVEERYADLQVSVGDFVLMGGDLPAMMLIEGLLRLVPGVVGKQESVQEESFSGPFVDYPEYTNPVEWQGLKVPDIVRSGNHGALKRWRQEKAAENTVRHHFSWLRSHSLDQSQKEQARAYIPPHYVALCHSQVRIGPDKQEGTTSVTSIDIHDVARSSKTYDMQGFFVVTPLKDQQKIIQHFLSFWSNGPGITYNKERYEAVSLVQMAPSIDHVIKEIEKKESQRPLIVGTTARSFENVQRITFYDQETVWHHRRPVLLVFGTGKGFTDSFLEQCDYVLEPVQGFSDFNHLSVRSAIAIVLDRWLGINVHNE